MFLFKRNRVTNLNIYTYTHPFIRCAIIFLFFFKRKFQNHKTRIILFTVQIRFKKTSMFDLVGLGANLHLKIFKNNYCILGPFLCIRPCTCQTKRVSRIFDFVLKPKKPFSQHLITQSRKQSNYLYLCYFNIFKISSQKDAHQT